MIAAPYILFLSFSIATAFVSHVYILLHRILTLSFLRRLERTSLIISPATDDSSIVPSTRM